MKRTGFTETRFISILKEAEASPDFTNAQVRSRPGTVMRRTESA